MDVITGQSLSGLVRVQPVEFLSEWPKVQGLKSVTTLGDSVTGKALISERDLAAVWSQCLQV